MSLAGRRTYADEIKWHEASPLMDYYVRAEVEIGGVKKALTSPPEAPARFYTVTLL
jgi:phage terminase large subunit-like protein